MNIYKQTIYKCIIAFFATLVLSFGVIAEDITSKGYRTSSLDSLVEPMFIPGNPDCSTINSTAEFSFKIQPVEDGVYHDAGTGFWVEIDVRQTSDGPVFDFDANFPVVDVIVKGGPNANKYSYEPPVTSDTGLHSPLNESNGKYYGLSHISFCFDEGGSINVTKVCDKTVFKDGGTEGPPRYNNWFFVTIENNGSIPLYDPTIEENINLSPPDICILHKVDNVVLPFTPLPENTPVDIPGVGVLNPGDDPVVLTIICNMSQNGFTNDVTAAASTVDGGESDISDDALSTGVCTAAPNPKLTVEKSCDEVRLMAMDDILAVEVLVNIAVENTGNETITNITVADSEIGPLSPAGFALAPGERKEFNHQSYMPDSPMQAPINGTDDKYNAETAVFTDTAGAVGLGVVSGPVESNSATANCPLCPREPR